MNTIMSSEIKQREEQRKPSCADRLSLDAIKESRDIEFLENVLIDAMDTVGSIELSTIEGHRKDKALHHAKMALMACEMKLKRMRDERIAFAEAFEVRYGKDEYQDELKMMGIA